jgi:hypothetical protein
MVSLQIAHNSKRYCESCIFRNINKVIERLNFNVSNFIRLQLWADEYKIPAQQQAGCVCVLNRFLTFETKEFDVVQKMEDLSMIRTQMRRPSELADWFEIIRDEN